jgi:hypothetical protein
MKTKYIFSEFYALYLLHRIIPIKNKISAIRVRIKYGTQVLSE